MKITTHAHRFYHTIAQRAFLLAGLLTVAASFAQAQYTIGGKTYKPYGNTETVVANFANPKGSMTAKRYSGLVMMEVTGTGQSPAENFNDAFYIYKGFFRQDSFFYQLGTTIQPTLHLNKGNLTATQVVYDVDANMEARGSAYVPAYREDHTYSFIIDLNKMQPAPKAPAALRIGVVDGIYTDNSGQYTVTLYQLQEDVDADCDNVVDACDICPNGNDAVDNNRDGIADCSQLLDFSAYSSAWKPSNSKILVCNNDQTMTIHKDMLATRFAMGYRVGPCNTCTTGDRNQGNDLSAAVAPVMSIAPNPAVDVLNITLDKALDASATLKVVDQSGRVVYSQQWASDAVQMRVNLLPNKFAAGLYTVQLINDDTVLSEQVTVVRQ